MELKDLIIPTEFGKNEKFSDMIYLPSYHELIQKYRFQESDFKVSWQGDVDYWWLRNDEIYQEPGSLKTYFDGCIENIKGNHYPVRDKFESWEDNIYDYIYDLNIKTRKTYRPNQCQCNIRPCMRLNINTYLKLIKQCKSYKPYKMYYPCLNLGQLFDIKTGKKTNKPIRWRILNWKNLPHAINPAGTGTAETVDLISFDVIGMSNFVFGSEDFEYYQPWKESAIRRNLNGYGDKKYSFLDNAFTDEIAILKNIKPPVKKKTLALQNNLDVLKKEFVETMMDNPEALRDLIPFLKVYIDSMEGSPKNKDTEFTLK